VKYPGLEGFVQLAWSKDLKPWGLTVSLWFNPISKEWAYLYKHKNDFHVAKSYEEQVKIHLKYGIPVFPPGSMFCIEEARA
jgi:hypothetical protein